MSDIGCVFLTNLQPNFEKLAKNQANVRMTDAQVMSWLEKRGYAQPMLVRYGEWLGVLPGWHSGWTKTERSPALHPCRCSGGGHIPLLRGTAGGSGRLLGLQGGDRGHRRTAAGACRQADVMGAAFAKRDVVAAAEDLAADPRKSGRSCSNARKCTNMSPYVAAIRRATGLPRAVPEMRLPPGSRNCWIPVFFGRDDRLSQAGSVRVFRKDVCAGSAR